MRLTTKIITGIILSFFFISLTFIIGFSFTDRKSNNCFNATVIDLPQDNITGIELAFFKTIIIDEIPFDSKNANYGLSDKCNIFFSSVTEKQNSDMLFIPAVLKDFISINMSNDTLMVKLNLRDLGEKYRNEEYGLNAVSGVNLYFNISKLDIISNIQALSISMKNIETDSIKVTSNGEILIDSCKARFVDPYLIANYRSFKIANCDIKSIYIDLDFDNMYNWHIEKSNIEEQIITGSRSHYITQYRNKSVQVNWIPKNNKAELNIKIPGDTTQIIIL